MLTKPTVFIVGAGASTEYGFPLGSALVKRVLNIARQPNGPFPRALKLNSASPVDLSGFCEALEGSDPDSIDTFLEGNADGHVNIGKMAIAYVILEAEAECLKHRRLSLGGHPDDHWLGYVWHKLRAGCTEAGDLAQSSVTFVVFNYDRVIETYLDTVIRNSFGLNALAASALREETFPIVHLHGQIADAAFGYLDPPTVPGTLPQFAREIRVVHDPVALSDSKFEFAKSQVAKAGLVCLLGFGYHPVNVGRLQLKEHIGAGVPVAGSTYGMGEAELRSARRAVGLDFLHSSSDDRCEKFLRACVDLV